MTLQLQCDDQENRQSMTLTGAAFGSYAVLAGIACVTVIVEKATARQQEERPLLEETSPEEHSSLDDVLPGFIRMLKNQPFRAMIVPWILDQTIVAMLSALLPFYVQYVISPEDICAASEPPVPETSLQCSSRTLLGIGLVFLLLTAIASMPVWQRIAREFGDYHTWLAFNFLNAATNILFIFGHSSMLMVILTIIFAMLNGLPIGASFLTDNILGLVIDYDELRTGVRSEASFTMFASFIPKLVSVPASAFPLTILALIGFKDPEEGQIQEQRTAVKWGVSVMFSVIPTLLALSSFALKATMFPFKDLQKADAEIKAGLVLCSLGEPYRDPLDGAFRQQKHSSSSGIEKRAENLLEHFSGLEIVERMQSAGTSFLVRRCVGQLCLFSSLTCVLALLTGLTMSLGFLNNNKLSWMPSLLVLFTGIAILASIVAALRLRAARILDSARLSREFWESACMRRRELEQEELPAEALERINAYTEEARSILWQRSVLSQSTFGSVRSIVVGSRAQGSRHASTANAAA